jgi:hypothetical protein
MASDLRRKNIFSSLFSLYDADVLLYSSLVFFLNIRIDENASKIIHEEN